MRMRWLLTMRWLLAVCGDELALQALCALVRLLLCVLVCAMMWALRGRLCEH